MLSPVIILHCSFWFYQHLYILLNDTCARHTSVYQPIFTCDCSPDSWNLFLNQTLGQATWSSWWNILMHCVVWFHDCHIPPYFHCIDRHQPLFQPCSLTPVLAESIPEHLVRHSHHAALGFPDPRCHCLALYQIQILPHICHRCQLDYSSGHSSWANVWCLKYFQVR